MVGTQRLWCETWAATTGQYCFAPFQRYKLEGLEHAKKGLHFLVYCLPVLSEELKSTLRPQKIRNRFADVERFMKFKRDWVTLGAGDALLKDCQIDGLTALILEAQYQDITRWFPCGARGCSPEPGEERLVVHLVWGMTQSLTGNRREPRALPSRESPFWAYPVWVPITLWLIDQTFKEEVSNETRTTAKQTAFARSRK